jgi:hypothetical protein
MSLLPRPSQVTAAASAPRTHSRNGRRPSRKSLIRFGIGCFRKISALGQDFAGHRGHSVVHGHGCSGAPRPQTIGPSRRSQPVRAIAWPGGPAKPDDLVSSTARGSSRKGEGDRTTARRLLHSHLVGDLGRRHTGRGRQFLPEVCAVERCAAEMCQHRCTSACAARDCALA